MNSIVIDLNGPQGNAFYLIGLAKRLSNQLGIEFEPIYNKMVEAEYDELLDTFSDHFGDYVEFR